MRNRRLTTLIMPLLLLKIIPRVALLSLLPFVGIIIDMLQVRHYDCSYARSEYRQYS